MTNREQEALRRSYRGKVSRCQGAFFEQMISAACNLYRERQIADIEKTPEPMQPTKDLGGGKFIAHYTGKGQADYKGFLWGGRAVNFEAKYTDSGKMMQDRVTKDQAERLERAQQYGGVAFVLCSFGSVAFYRIPWVVWRDMKGNFGRKYIMPADVEQYRVKIGAPGVPLFLEGLEAQSIEREEHS
jgi:recombination protein U